MAMPCAEYGTSGSRMLSPPSWDSRASRCESPNSFRQNSTFDPVKKHSEWYKHLDFEDEIFIPSFCSVYFRRVSPATTRYHYRELSSSGSTTVRQTKTKVPVVINPEPVAWHLRPSPPSSISVSEHAIEFMVATPATSEFKTGKNGRRRTEILNSANCHFTQCSPRSTPPRTPTLLKTSVTVVPSKDPRGAEEIAREIMAEQQRVNNMRGICTHAAFIPSRAALERNAQKHEEPEAFQWRIGRPDDEAKHYGQHIEAHKNCAIFITGIPMEATYADVLDSVYGGKIYACRFEPDTGKFATRAVKLVFFTRFSAERFMHQNDLVGIFILGIRVKAIWNRIRYSEYTNAHQSRVVNITGLARWMHSAFLEDYFKQRFDYDLDRIVGVPCPRQGYVTQAWHFACLRAQAEFAKMIIERELRDVFTVEYGVDLCDRPWF